VPGSTPFSRLATVALALACAPVSSCDRSSGPEWLPLDERLALDAPAERRSIPLPWRAGRSAELVAEHGGATLHVSIRREDWHFKPKLGVWVVPIELFMPPRAADNAVRLTTPQGPVSHARPAQLASKDQHAFTLVEGQLALSWPGDAPPEESTLSCAVLERSRSQQHRIDQGAFSGRGLTLLAGERASCRVDIGPGSALRFGTAARPFLGPVAESDGCVFRVRLDGEIRFEHRVRPDGEPGSQWHVVPLPDDGVHGARLDFEVEGSPASAMFFEPTLGPREIGRRGARPWKDARADIVVFVADTLRADSLAAYGGQPGITPHLDELAGRGLCFARAWSTATWTLPSHVSMFSGYYPPQVLPPDARTRLPQAVETVAEKLARAGYRTGAITGGGFVSSQFGVDQGFGYFLEESGELDELLSEARGFLDADDGRPTFLFVQTYRVHWPYHASERTRSELGERLALRGEADKLLDAVRDEAHAQGATSVRVQVDMTGLPSSPRMAELARQMHAHYLGGVADLDRDFATFLEHLRSSGLLESGYLVFTSDHGEGFCEHAAFFHGRVPFEEQMRVPLLIAGRNLTARRIDHPVSLIDLAPTLAEMAGVQGQPDWPGRSLLSGGAKSGAIFGFEASGNRNDSLFVLEEEKKILCVPEGTGARLVGAYDLARDGREEHDLSATDAAWPQELLGRHGASIRTLITPLVQGEAVELDADKLAELRELGY